MRALLLLLLLLPGCASFYGGPYQPVTIRTNPPGARVLYPDHSEPGNLRWATTPCTVLIDRYDDEVWIGHPDYRGVFKHELGWAPNPDYALNLLVVINPIPITGSSWPGVLGLIVDLVTGAWVQFDGHVDINIDARLRRRDGFYDGIDMRHVHYQEQALP